MASEATRIRTAAEEALARHFAALGGGDPVHDMRATAFDAFMARGLPHRRVEDWKYTDLRALMKEAYAPAPPPEPQAARAALARADVFDGLDRARLAFVDGHFVPALSDLAGLEEAIEFASLGRFLAQGGAILDRFADDEASPILDLNRVFMRDGAVIRVKPGVTLARPLEIVTVFSASDPGLQTLRHEVALGEGASAVILDAYAGPDGVAYHTNAVADIRVARGARLVFVKAQEEGDRALHLAMLRARVEDGAIFDPFLFSAGGALARSEVRLGFEGEGSSSALRGVTIARGRQHSDTTLVVDHAVPSCTSREFFKAALGDEAKGVFQGKIIVRPYAQKTDGRMMSQGLLLGEGAEFANKPELEIFADDVQCAHGATCGQIDEEMLFYLRARGIPRREAETLLVLAFLAEVIEEIGEEAVEEALEARTRRFLHMGAET